MVKNIHVKSTFCIKPFVNLDTSGYKIYTMQDLARKHNPTALRLKELKAPLQKEAMKQDRSLNWLVLKILKDYVVALDKKEYIR